MSTEAVGRGGHANFMSKMEVENLYIHRSGHLIIGLLCTLTLSKFRIDGHDAKSTIQFCQQF